MLKLSGLSIIIAIIFTEVVQMSAFEKSSEVTLFVANNGSDAWSGRIATPNAAETDGPFVTLERAREEIRRMKQSGGMPAGGVTVELQGGVYQREGAFELSAEDSGREGAPVVYRARQGEDVRLVGGKVVTNFEPVTDAAILERLAPESRHNVLQANLKELGITDFGEVQGGGLELFFEHKPMPLARWPNEGFVKIVDLVGGDPVDVRGTKGDKIGKFFYEGDRPKRWDKENDLWVHGYWFWDWSDQRHRVESIDTARRIIAVEPPYHGYGYRVGQWFYGLNILAELDRPGEWYLEREAGVLYFWPPSSIEEGQPTVSVIDTLVRMENVEHVNFQGITFEAARGTAIKIIGGTHNRIVGCTLRNLGSWAVNISGGTHNGVIGCDIYETGDGGISLSGGDRKQLESARHYAENNHIHHYSRWNRMYNPAISISGVGNCASHNLIHNAPHMAIGFSGNDHLIEFNEIHSVCYESNDAGAMYSGRDWTMRGTVIRHNYLHHISGFEGRGCVGVYLDDMFCGTEIYGNVFYKVTRAAFIGGGRDCVVENNIFVDCQPALHIDARAMGWANYHVDTTMKERLQATPYQEPLWAARYPELVGIWEDEPAIPKGHLVARNIFQGGTWDGVRDEARPYVTFEDNLIDQEVGFSEKPPENFQLRDDSPAYKVGFKRIPIEKIGLYKDENRASWPVQHEVR
ncbi:MAG: right-handed parallel beta-helix repeat-containing protein [Candidatus Poribacteria bacterium]